MFAFLALLFLVVPFVELFLLIQVGQAVGALPTILALVVVSVVGAWLVKREGIGVLRRAREQVQSGRVPGSELVDGVLILFAGALLVTPGFLTDVLGILLLVPPVRVMLRSAASARLARRAAQRIDRL
ncbi:MAG: FxsA family protein [Actinobacteria bacterium]|nr:FxsA family protein [Actinomycetota bacterium]